MEVKSSYPCYAALHHVYSVLECQMQQLGIFQVINNQEAYEIHISLVASIEK